MTNKLGTVVIIFLMTTTTISLSRADNWISLTKPMGKLFAKPLHSFETEENTDVEKVLKENVNAMLEEELKRLMQHSYPALLLAAGKNAQHSWLRLKKDLKQAWSWPESRRDPG